MKKTAKRIISLLLTAVMVFGAAPLSGFVGLDLPDISGLLAPKAEAATEYTEGRYTYTVDENDNATITNVSTSIRLDITIPESLGGYPVTHIGDNAFEECIYLTSITIPNGVTTIGNYAFACCSNLANITIPNSVTSIGNYAFEDCVVLKSITIPDGVKTIGNYAFYKCKNLTNAIIGNGVTDIMGAVFSNCSKLTSITIGNSVKYIGSNSFYNCTVLTDVYYTGDIAGWCGINFSYDSYTNPMWYAENLYIDGKLLTELIIPDSVTSINYAAFMNIKSLKNITIPDSVTYIGSYAFYGCTALSDVYYRGSEEQWKKITINSYNESLTNATIHFNDKNSDIANESVEGINVFSSSGSTSIAQGESSRYAVCVYENGERKNDVSNLAFINETPDIFTISRNNDTENGYCYITVKAKNCGIGFLQINNTSTGETARIIISVINPNANSYTIHNVPELANHGEHTPNILYFNGLNIDDFKYEKQNNDGCIMDFNVFNTLPVYALVTVFDASGKPVSTRLINKHEQYAESLYSGLVDEPIKLLKDTLSGDLFSYRQTGGYSTETNISVFVPSGGYIKITNNSTQSGVLELINFFDAFIKFKSLVTGALDLSKWKPVEFDCLQTAAEDLLKKTEDEHIKSFKSSVFMDCVKEVTFSPESLIDCANSISNCIESLDPEFFDIIADNAIKVGVDIGEDFFTTFAGAAGAALKGAFLYNTYWNIYENLYYIGATSNVGAISIRNPNESTDTMTYDGVTVINPNGFDSETSLSTYMVTFDEGLPEDFKNNVLNSDVIKNFCESHNISIEQFVENKELYQLHDITFIKNGKEYQPGSEVEVFLPVSEEMKSEASWWERLKVYRIEDDGTLTDMNAKYSSRNDMVSFKTNHFSLYLVLVEKGLSIAIKTPSTTTISYGDSITLHAELNATLSEGAYVEWSTNNSNFRIVSLSLDDLSCKITPEVSGDTEITVTVYDIEDNVICSDTQIMTAKAGFFQKIIAFFKKLFGLTKDIPNVIKKVL